ncbi:MAG: prepilin peptidase [Gemmatimonadaceae bacterium]
MTDVLTSIFAFAIGACIGSFLNVCIARWPAGMSVIRPPSRCPACERPIRAYENVPILGWISLRGRCAGCASSISPQYPLVELLVALVWMGATIIFGPTLLALRVAVFATIMLGIAITDAKHYEIPDGFTIFGLVWVIATAIAASVAASGAPSAFAGVYDSFMGAMVGAGLTAIAGWLGEAAFDKEAMGFGDVTLMAVIGAALGPERALLTFFVGAALGAVTVTAVTVYARVSGNVHHLSAVNAAGNTGDGEPQIVPFGVFLAPAALITLFYGNPLIHWYLARFINP